MSTSARRRKLAISPVVIPASTPRNSLMLLAKQRSAGKHEVSKSTERRKAARSARVEAESALKK